MKYDSSFSVAELITTLDVCLIGKVAVNDVLISLYNTVKLRAAHLFVPSDFDCGLVCATI